MASCIHLDGCNTTRRRYGTRCPGLQEFHRLNPDRPRLFALAGARAMGDCHGQLLATTETALETRKPANALANALGTRPPEPNPEPKGRSRPQGLGPTSHGAQPRARSNVFDRDMDQPLLPDQHPQPRAAPYYHTSSPLPPKLSQQHNCDTATMGCLSLVGVITSAKNLSAFPHNILLMKSNHLFILLHVPTTFPLQY